METKNNTTMIYKYRHFSGLGIYEVINGEFGVDSTLHLKDTTCTHYGPACEIEVTKSEEGNSYLFSKALNSSAEEYIFYHEKEAFWATKEEAFIEILMSYKKTYNDDIEKDKKYIADTTERLKEYTKKEINYFTPELAKKHKKCYINSGGVCNIIGEILFNNGTTGYLTDDCYINYDDDGDRIILIEKDGKFITERNETVYLSIEDYRNDNINHSIDVLKDTINNSKITIKKCIDTIEKIDYIIENRNNLTYEDMFKLYYDKK